MQTCKRSLTSQVLKKIMVPPSLVYLFLNTFHFRKTKSHSFLYPQTKSPRKFILFVLMMYMQMLIFGRFDSARSCVPCSIDSCKEIEMPKSFQVSDSQLCRTSESPRELLKNTSAQVPPPVNFNRSDMLLGH